jgi:hypothetical protein
MKSPINNHILWLFVAIACSSSDLPAQLSVIHTKNGTVEGYNKDDITIFKGIPFAAPPIGDFTRRSLNFWKSRFSKNNESQL